MYLTHLARGVEYHSQSCNLDREIHSKYIATCLYSVSNPSLLQASESFMSTSSVISDISLTRVSHEPTLRIGFYKGAVIAVKMLQKTGVLLTRTDHLELKTVRLLLAKPIEFVIHCLPGLQHSQNIVCLK